MVLQNLRKGASGLIAKVFLLVLMVSFVLWGISGVFHNIGGNTVAKVGGTEISADAFRQQYLDQIQRISRQAGRPITQEQARAFGLDRQVLNQMVADATLDDTAKALGLAITDAAIADQLRANPALRPQGATAFDPAYFQQLLRANGLTEQTFLAAEKKRVLRQQIAAALADGVAVPDALRDLMHRYESEQRSISYLDVTAAAAGAIPAPTDEQVKAFFDSHKVTFRAPEYRKITVLVLTPATLAPWVQVSDADVKAAYDRNAARFGTPEQREVQQIVFPSEADARAAEEKLKAGTPFAEIATARGLTPKDTDLGLVAKGDIIDPKVAEAAFALPADGTSDPIQGRFGYTLVHVGKIVPAAQKPLAEVEAGLRQELALDKARRELLDKHDAIEDERGSGATLLEVSQKLGLQTETIDAVDRSGRDPAGAEVNGIPARADVLSAAFASRPGTDNDPVQLPQNGGYVWFDVDEVTPARERPLDEVREQVVARWTEDETVKAVDAKAKDLLAQLEAGKAMDEVATGAGLQVKTLDGLMRGRANGDFSAADIAKVFAAKDKGFGLASGAVPAERLVFQVTKVTVPPEGESDARNATQLQQQLENDLLQQYLTVLQSGAGVSINERAFLQATGASAAN